MKTTQEMIEVMQAFEDGKEIESIERDNENAEWGLNPSPAWVWNNFDYRIKPNIKTEIVFKCPRCNWQATWSYIE